MLTLIAYMIAALVIACIVGIAICLLPYLLILLLLAAVMGIITSL